MGLIRWIKKERIRRKARKEIRACRAAAADTRQGQRQLARQIEDIRKKQNADIAVLYRVPP